MYGLKNGTRLFIKRQPLFSSTKKMVWLMCLLCLAIGGTLAQSRVEAWLSTTPKDNPQASFFSSQQFAQCQASDKQLSAALSSVEKDLRGLKIAGHMPTIQVSPPSSCSTDLPKHGAVLATYTLQETVAQANTDVANALHINSTTLTETMVPDYGTSDLHPNESAIIEVRGSFPEQDNSHAMVIYDLTNPQVCSRGCSEDHATYNKYDISNQLINTLYIDRSLE